MSRYLLFFIIAPLSLVLSQNDAMEDKVGNPDDMDRIERPCTVYDQNCIRKFFEEHAHCKKVFGNIPEVVIRPQVNYEIPRVNMSIIITDLNLRASNARIDEFYIDKYTDKLVIAIEFRNVSENSEINYFKFHRRAKEPVITMAPASVLYNSIIVTAVIPKLDDLQLHKAECTTYGNDAAPPTTVGPSGLESSDPQVASAVTQFLGNLAINVQELFLTDSAYMAALFIQYTICDFGLYVP